MAESSRGYWKKGPQKQKRLATLLPLHTRRKRWFHNGTLDATPLPATIAARGVLRQISRESVSQRARQLSSSKGGSSVVVIAGGDEPGVGGQASGLGSAAG